MSLQKYIDRFKDLKILCIGDIMLDRFMYGNVSRISPEAPVPVFNFKNQKEMLGGAGNVVANLTTLGCKVSFIGVVGDDADGKKVADMLKNSGVKAHLLYLKNISTIVKTRMIAGNNHLLRVDIEDKFPTPADITNQIDKIVTMAVKSADLILLSDYNKGTLPSVVVQAIINKAKEYDKKVLIDPKGIDYTKYAGADLVKPNLKEFKLATNSDPEPKSPNFKEQLRKAAEYLFSYCKIKNVLVTLSEYGMAYIPSDPSKEVLVIPTKAKEVFDVSGAGDTTLAALGASICAGAEMIEAMNIANCASGIVVGKLGTACVSADELKKALSEDNKQDYEEYSKILSREKLVPVIENLKKQGKKIGFTNGCFDLLHLGHINSFQLAKKECDILVVAVNTDEGVHKLKGPDRPIQDEKTRSNIIAALECVDYVVLFDEDTALETVMAIKPNVICKQGYTIDKWPEAQAVEAYGGKAIVLPIVEGYSTTNTLKKIRNEK
ncbi:MAG: D-glycero-beta-D-manno-heptose-7-phosphate kinase [Alphaproteobacteria bacterium]|nr:D-glycero-beta-D-manno-heptose-7-phosphate kinase [Alphaproteobacteria bacterium]